MDKIPLKIKLNILQRDNNTCQKCGFHDPSSEALKVLQINPLIFKENNFITLCLICYKHAPDNPKQFEKYIKEKIDWKLLDTFRKSNNSISKKTKLGMTKKFNLGNHITKAPKGYKLLNKQLIQDPENAEKIKQIFNQFLNTKISLTQLAKQNNMTTAGIKKILQNTTYIGKVKFANQETQGNHKPIISTELFKKIQEKLN